ncbi:MAG: beta-ketoacyl synthase N-terminal-like domain-containing protein, partial [Actinomycetota bacterium]
MPEAVIVATSRTPIGRANKGSLVDARPDDMSAFILSDVMGKAGVEASDVEDVIWGIGQPGGEGGYNIARVISAMQGLDIPGVTVNRYCSSSLQTIRMASHAIKAGEGDCFVAGGVETVSRYLHGAADTGPHNETFAEAALNRGFFENEITPYTLPDGTVVTKDDGIRAGTTLEKVSQLQPAFRPGGTVTAGNACPLNDGASAVVVMSDTKAKAMGLEPIARIISSGVSALNP